jgi:hypothetical protein
MDMPLSMDSIGIIFTYLAISFGLICFFTGIIGLPLSIILYITFPKKIKEEFLETSPDKTARWGYDSYLAYYIFPTIISLVTVSDFYKKKVSNHYNFKEKLSKRRLSFFRFHFYITAISLISGALAGLLIVTVEALEYFNLIQTI